MSVSNSRYLISLLLLASCCLTNLKGQSERVKDAELWLKASAETDITKNLEIGLEEQVRFDKNFGELKSYFTELSLKYDINDPISLLARMRYTTRNDNSGATQGRFNYLRYQLGTRIKHEAGQFRFQHRLLYQRGDRTDLKPDEGDIIKRFIRYKFETEYKIKNWSYDPIISLEYFNALKNEIEEEPNALRFSIGTENKVDKVGTLGIQFRYEWTVDYLFPAANAILALSYKYSF